MPKSLPLRIILFSGIIGLALFGLRMAVIAQSSFSGLSAGKAVRNYQQQPRLLVAYGRQAILEDGNLQAAEQWYQRALVANPLYIPAWLALSELQNDAGDSAGAMAILDYVDGLTRNIARRRWEKAMLAYQLDRFDILTADLSWLLTQKEVSGRTKHKALKLAFRLWPEPDELVSKMGNTNIAILFRHAVRTNNLDTAGYLWPMLDQSAPEGKEVLPYINRLISAKEIATAARIWQKYFPSEGLLYNADFSTRPINSGFGWRISKIKGVLTETAAAKNKKIKTRPQNNDFALHLQFTGTTNINYAHTRQLVPLSAGHSYTLAGKIRTRGLSTEQTPYLEVTGLYCPMRPVTTAMVQADQDWTPFSLDFAVPEECEGIRLRIRRRPSTNIDNLIAGDLWLTDLALRKNAPDGSGLHNKNNSTILSATQNNSWQSIVSSKK
jgi:hypothetical protein